MVRAFTGEAVPASLLAELVDLARRAPSAGNTQARAFLSLTGTATARYWDAALPPGRREGFAWPGLVAAPALVVCLVRPETYVDRYGEPDKAATGLGEDAGAWAVPYWWVDAGMAVEHLLLGATAAGLGACFFGLFDHERAVLDALGVPAGWRGVGTVALGTPAPDRPGRSATRPRSSLDEVWHRQGW